MQIGFIGLGNMGMGMAKRLLAAGYEVTAYNRSEEKVTVLTKLGAKKAAHPRDLAGLPVIITMLADDQALEAVTWGESGFFEHLSTESLHISMSTISVDLSRRLAQAHEKSGSDYLAAPVLGRPDAAEAGKLFIFAGGSEALIKKSEPILSVLGQKTFPVIGEAWRAHLVKLGCNFMLQSAVETMAEAFALVRKGGLEASDFFEIFSTTLFNAPVYKNYGAMIVEQKYFSDKGFKMPLARKDTGLVLAAAKELGVPMPAADLIYHQFTQAIERGEAELDMSGLGKIAADNAGLK